jgi:hypothetical protein
MAGLVSCQQRQLRVVMLKVPVRVHRIAVITAKSAPPRVFKDHAEAGTGRVARDSRIPPRLDREPTIALSLASQPS